jgi:hypothetical protein
MHNHIIIIVVVVVRHLPQCAGTLHCNKHGIKIETTVEEMEQLCRHLEVNDLAPLDFLSCFCGEWIYIKNSVT